MTDPKPLSEGIEPQNKKWYAKPRYQGLLFAVGILIFVLVVGWMLDWYINPHTSGQKKDLVQALGLITAGVAGAFGIYFTWRNLSNAQNQLRSTQDQLHLARQGQLTDRFTKAIDQLGKTDDNNPPNKIEEIRLGGIYALEQIALDAPDKYHWPIVQVLVAYLRRYVMWQDDPFTVNPGSADIQTVLDVIGRRSRYFGEGEDEPLALGGLDFSSYVFPPRAHLEGAWLGESHLESATLTSAQLNKASFVGAHLEGAYLWDADLTGADLSDAYLTATDLRGITVSEKTKLDPEKLKEANGNWDAELGEIPKPKWWVGALPGNDTILEPGEYSIKLWKTLLHLNDLGKGWYSSLALPYQMTLSPAGVITSGLSITFTSGPWVCDPQKPKADYALKQAPADMVAWFWKHPHLTPATQPEEWENQSGGAAGKQFYVEVHAAKHKEELDMSDEGPTVPVFPSNPRNATFSLAKDKKNLVIVLEGEDEWMVIVIEGPASKEFDKFKARVDEEVLANLYWGDKAHEHLEGG